MGAGAWTTEVRRRRRAARQRHRQAAAAAGSVPATPAQPAGSPSAPAFDAGVARRAACKAKLRRNARAAARRAAGEGAAHAHGEWLYTRSSSTAIGCCRASRRSASRPRHAQRPRPGRTSSAPSPRNSPAWASRAPGSTARRSCSAPTIVRTSSLLQNAMDGAHGDAVVYYVFDLPFASGLQTCGGSPAARAPRAAQAHRRGARRRQFASASQ